MGFSLSLQRRGRHSVDETGENRRFMVRLSHLGRHRFQLFLPRHPTFHPPAGKSPRTCSTRYAFLLRPHYLRERKFYRLRSITGDVKSRRGNLTRMFSEVAHAPGVSDQKRAPLGQTIVSCAIVFQSGACDRWYWPKLWATAEC